MNSDDRFRAYLEGIEDELLECVAADFAGLETLFRGERAAGKFRERRKACREECVRRHRPELFHLARSIPHPGLDPAA